MATTVSQVYYSERLTTDERKPTQKYVSGDIEYIVKGAADEDAAVIAVRAYVASRHLGMKLNSISMDERIDDTSWRVTVGYGYAYGSTGASDEETKPESTLSFDFATSTKHVERSLLTLVRKNVSGGTAKSYNNLIGVEADGSVQGVDILAPVMTFSETHFFYDRSMTTVYKKKLAGLVGKVNHDSWRGYDAGEVLFLGVSGSRNGVDKDDLWQLTYKFAVQQNESNATIAGVEEIEKQGWDYAWVKYYEKETNVLDNEGNATGEKIVEKKPEAVYVEQVYYLADFRQIGIGS